MHVLGGYIRHLVLIDKKIALPISASSVYIQR